MSATEPMTHIHAIMTVQKRFQWRGESRPTVDAFNTALEVLVRTHDARLLWDLVPYALREDADSADVRKAMAQLLKDLKPGGVPALDLALRHCIWGEVRGFGHEIDVTHLKRLEQAPHPEAIRVLMTCASNGHLREASVRGLGAKPVEGDLPFLLWRLNDWVEPVRVAAGQVVVQRLQPTVVPHLVKCLPLLCRLRTMMRAAGANALERVFGFIAHADCQPALEQGLDSSDREVRRVCAGLLLERAGQDVVERVLKDHDVVVRRQAVGFLFQRPGIISTALPLLLRDSTAAVRGRALDWMIEHTHEDLPRWLRTFLLDRDSRVRSLAQWHFEEEDPAAFYRRHLSKGPWTVIAGVGECGAATDAAMVEPFLRDSRPAFRAAAVQALAQLEPNAYAKQFISMVDDPAAEVCKRACAALQKLTIPPSAEQLFRLMETARHPHARRLLLVMISRSGKWTSLAYLMLALAHEDPTTATEARARLERWFQRANQGATQPGASDRLLITSAVERVGSALPAAWLNEILAMVR